MSFLSNGEEKIHKASPVNTPLCDYAIKMNAGKDPEAGWLSWSRPAEGLKLTVNCPDCLEWMHG